MSVTVTQAIELGVQIAELNQTMLMLGPPGIGKTDALKEIAVQSGRKLFLEHPAVAAPEDYKGFAMFYEGEADFYPLGQIKEIIACTVPCIVGIDDLPQAALATQNGLMQFIHPRGRRLGKLAIPDHAAIIACGNRKEDNAGVMGLTEPLKDRFATIVEIEVSLDEWTEWAMSFGINPLIIAFLHYRPALLSSFKASRDMRRTPTPRAWEGVSNLLRLTFSSQMLQLEAITGAVGEQAANEFMQFSDVLTTLPDLDDIERGFVQDGSGLSGSAIYAVVGALAIRGQTSRALENVTHYIETLPTEFKVLWSEMWYKINRNREDEAGIKLTENPAWGRWIQKYSTALTLK